MKIRGGGGGRAGGLEGGAQPLSHALCGLLPCAIDDDGIQAAVRLAIQQLQQSLGEGRENTC